MKQEKNTVSAHGTKKYKISLDRLKKVLGNYSTLTTIQATTHSF